MSFDKTGYQLILFQFQHSLADDVNQGNGFMPRESHFIFKTTYEFKGFGANRLLKELATKG